MMTHLGVADEEQINNMSYVMFEQILEELGHKLIYEAVANYAGNSFCDKSWEMIMEHYPMSAQTGHKGGGQSNGLSGLAKLIQKSNVKVLNKGENLPGSLGKIQKGLSIK